MAFCCNDAQKQEEAREDELLEHARFKTGHTSKAKSIRPAGGNNEQRGADKFYIITMTDEVN